MTGQPYDPVPPAPAVYRWVRGSFRTAAHLSAGSRRTLCGTPLGYGTVEPAHHPEARKCGRCRKAARFVTVAEVTR